jgi:hypothetical protein
MRNRKLTLFEQLASWYLRRRGMCFLPRNFLGVAVGCCVVIGRKEKMTVIPTSPQFSQIIALNHSHIDIAERADE